MKRGHQPNASTWLSKSWHAGKITWRYGDLSGKQRVNPRSRYKSPCCKLTARRSANMAGNSSFTHCCFVWGFRNGLPLTNRTSTNSRQSSLFTARANEFWRAIGFSEARSRPFRLPTCPQLARPQFQQPFWHGICDSYLWSSHPKFRAWPIIAHLHG